MPMKVCRGTGGAVWRRMHKVGRTQTPCLGKGLNLAPGWKRFTCLGCCGTWLHTFAQPPSSSEQVLHPTETGTHNLDIAWDGPSWFPRSQRAQRLAEEIPSVPQQRWARAITERVRKSRSLWLWGNPFRSRALFQSPFIPAWLLLAALPAPLADGIELGDRITLSVQHPGFVLLQGGFCSCSHTSYNTIFQCCKQCNFC